MAFFGVGVFPTRIKKIYGFLLVDILFKVVEGALWSHLDVETGEKACIMLSAAQSTRRCFIA